MVRTATIAFLAVAVSLLVAQQVPVNASEPILDVQGNPLSEDRQEEFIKLDQLGQKKFDDLVATYTQEQQKVDQELKDISKKQGDILGIPKSG